MWCRAGVFGSRSKGFAIWHVASIPNGSSCLADRDTRVDITLVNRKSHLGFHTGDHAWSVMVEDNQVSGAGYVLTMVMEPARASSTPSWLVMYALSVDRHGC